MANSTLPTSEQVDIYHEKQSLMKCAVHAVNCLLQMKNAVTKQQFDEICSNLSPDSWINPHRSMFGLGNYDVNVIMAALQQHGYQTIWFDRRKSTRCLCPDNIFGYLVNIPGRMSLGFVPLPIPNRHWFAVRRIAGVFYNLDSKLNKPQTIEQNVVDYLQTLLDSDSSVQLLLIVTEDVTASESWQLVVTGGGGGGGSCAVVTASNNDDDES